MNILTSSIRADGEYGELLSVVRRNFKDKPLPLLANGLCEGAAEAFLVSLIEDTCTPLSPDGGKSREGRKRTALIICPEEKDCLRLVQTLGQFGLRAALFSSRDLSFHDVVASHEYEQARMKVLSGLVAGGLDAVVATPDAAVGCTIPPDVLRSRSLHIGFDSAIDTATLARQLVAAGYARVELVEGAGQFAIRGDIIDVCAPFGSYLNDESEVLDGSRPLRIELFGDEIDRMGLFDPDTQRMTTDIQEADLLPAREMLTDGEGLARLETVIGAQRRAAASETARRTLEEELFALGNARRQTYPSGSELHFLDKYMKVIYPESACLLDYFSDRTLFVIRSTSAVTERLRSSEKMLMETVTTLVEDGYVPGKYAEYARPAAAFDLFLERNVTVHVDSLSYGTSGRRLGGIFGFRTRHMVSYAENFRLLTEDLTAYRRDRYRTAVIAENEAAARSLAGLLEEAGFRAVIPGPDSLTSPEELPADTVVILWRQYLFGYELMVPRIVVLSTNPDSRTGALSTAPAVLRAKKKAADARNRNTKAILSYNDLQVGDYVVHESYGIGVFVGIETLTIQGVTHDYIGIRYAGSDKLDIPVEQLDKVSKYIGAHGDDGTLKLSRLGTDYWARTKQRTSAVVKEMAKDLIRLYAERTRRPGIAFAPDDDFQQEFADAFEYEETPGQLAAIGDISADMQRPVPMDRLLCGDVGYGKTEVAMRAAFKAVAEGYQVAVLVPTTILALQHFQTFSRRMRSFSVNVDMISRFRTQKEQQVSLRSLERGDTDIIVGTHRLLGKDIRFRKLGLLIVDEEQRFGVAQKEKLKQLCSNIDVLTLSATPIPRTLNMAMGGIRDISLLEEAPNDRLPVQTYVLEHDDMIINEAIRRELRRGGQVFWLHNTVEDIEEVAGRIGKAFPDAHIVTAHGRMDKDTLEEIWERMLTGGIDILVCTTIIETGVDIPNANTLIVDCADRLGLSQLHQLRGRVGRSSRRAFAYFTYRRGKTLSELSEKRLSAIREYAEFGAGYRIALRDMEIRGCGNLLGAEQHGHMEAVGYDLYIKLLNAAVLEEKGEAPAEEPECVVTLNVSAFLPESYVRYPAQRMALYKRIALIRTREDLEDMTDELGDRYGELPAPAVNLLNIALIRSMAVTCGIGGIRQDGNAVILSQKQFDADVWSDLSDEFRGRLHIIMGDVLSVKLQLRQDDSVTGILRKLLSKYIEIMRAQG